MPLSTAKYERGEISAAEGASRSGAIPYQAFVASQVVTGQKKKYIQEMLETLSAG